MDAERRDGQQPIQREGRRRTGEGNLQPQHGPDRIYWRTVKVEPDAAEVKAAGGVVWRRPPAGGIEVALVHRPRYDDWSLPKGKLDRGETWEDAAVREVEEEIGVRCRLGHELSAIAYTDHKGRSKAVRYWLMEATAEHEFVPSDEVDEVRWLEGRKALGRLSYPLDRGVLGEALESLQA